MLRTFGMEKHTKPILICSLCLRRGYVTHLPLYISCPSYVGTTVKSKLFSTSAVNRLSVGTQSKKKMVFSMSEARRLLSLAKPEKWKLFGKIFQKLKVYSVQY
jgi:hypothetical protein